MQDVPDEIIQRQLKLFDKVDPAYGKGVCNALRKCTVRPTYDPIERREEP